MRPFPILDMIKIIPIGVEILFGFTQSSSPERRCLVSDIVNECAPNSAIN